MLLHAEKLQAHLRGQLAPLYWIAGDDPLLMQEACDSIRKAAKQHAFLERKIVHLEKKDSWQKVLSDANALSLFSNKVLIDVRTSISKLDYDAILSYLKNPNPGALVLISTNKSDSSTQKTQWFNALEKACVFVPISSLDKSQFLHWLSDRVRDRKISLQAEAQSLLAEYTEGNLLAAAQELDKLALQFGEANISLEQLQNSISNYALYDVFALNDALLAGDATVYLRILAALQQEGTAALAIIGALGRELRQLASVREEMARGLAVQACLDQAGVWRKRQPLFKNALSRVSQHQTRAAIRQLASIDQACRGMTQQDPWQLLASLCLMF